MKRFSLTIALALCVALPASAQLFKWVDENGKVQYSDKPPPSNVKTEKIRKPATAASAAASGEVKGGAAKDAAKDAGKAGPKTVAEQDQAFRKRQADAAKAEEGEAQKQAQAREAAENCRRAKESVAALELGGRQSRVDEKGERVFLDDAQIGQELARARQNVATMCK
jgi:hypothetical protein